MDHGTTTTVNTQIFTSSSSIKWRVLSTNTSTGEVVLISETPIKTDEGSVFYMKGAIGYLFAEQELNNICSKYGYGPGANRARSINVDDINTITGYTPTTGNSYTKSIYYPTIYSETGYSSSAESITDTSTDYAYTGSEYLTDTTSEMYKMLFRDTEDSSNISYWLASRFISSYSSYSSFGARTVYDGAVDGNILGKGLSSGFNDSNTHGLGVRPIVYLKTTVQTSGKDASGAWTIIDN